jgi:DNA-binding CsgD family transcriptional regulator
MRTIYDDLLDIDSIEEKVASMDYDPDSMFGGYMATISGLSVTDMMTATLMHIGYTKEEIATYRGIKRKSVDKTIERAIEKIY